MGIPGLGAGATTESQNRYFRKCLANGGNMDHRPGENQVMGEIEVKM
jgi:hypothetical protein